MLRAYAISFPEKWDECLKLVEFSYNNSYQESIRMAPFEALYGKKCRTPLNWVEVGDRGYFGPDFIKEAREQVSIIQSFVGSSEPIESLCGQAKKAFAVCSWGLCVPQGVSYSPMRGVHWFGVHGKLAPRYVGPYKVLALCGPVAYRL